jgi:hypothetical protein
MQQLKKPMRAPRRTTLLRNDIIVNMLSESTLMNGFFRVGADQLCQKKAVERDALQPTEWWRTPWRSRIFAIADCQNDIYVWNCRSWWSLGFRLRRVPPRPLRQR